MHDRAPTLPDDTQLVRAFSLTERLMTPAPEAGALPAEARPSALRRAGSALRYWLWRAGGRRRPGGDAGRMAENYEREIARLTETLRRQGEKALARQRQRVAELERLTGQLQKAYEAELEKLRRQLAERHERPAATGEMERALARAGAAEERARLAENKVEMLKEALEITRARAAAGNGSPAPDRADGNDRFRDAKRAFARSFHPDHGGRDDPERARVFLEFWPMLERIERGE